MTRRPVSGQASQAAWKDTVFLAPPDSGEQRHVCGQGGGRGMFPFQERNKGSIIHVELGTDVIVILIIANIYRALTLKYFICVNSLNSQNSTIEVGILTIILILQRRKVKHREVKEFVQRC